MRNIGRWREYFGCKWEEVARGCSKLQIRSKSAGNCCKMPRQRHVCVTSNEQCFPRNVSFYACVWPTDRPTVSVSHSTCPVYNSSVSCQQPTAKHFVWPSQRYVTFSTRCYVFFTITKHNCKPQKKCFFPLKTKIVPTSNSKAYSGGKARLHPFWTIDGDEWSALRTGRLTPGKECPVPDE